MSWLRVTACLALLAAFLSGSIIYALAVWRSVFPAANNVRRQKILKQLNVQDNDRILAGLFHPYCNAGGGGERVLWTAVACLQREEPKVICIIYTGDVSASKDEIVTKVKARFSIELDPSRLHFVYLKNRYLVEDATWRHFTLLGQSLGSVVLGYEAIRNLSPDIFIDTMGYAFTFPLVRLLARVPVGAYVHYPTISTNMLQRVKDRAAGHTNTSAVSKSHLLSSAKLVYYLIFARMYSFCLRQADYVMVNSTWTQGHVNGLLSRTGNSEAGSSKAKRDDGRRSARIVYPPCDTQSMSSLPLEVREKIILSLAQFRPEKEHSTQLRFFKAFMELAGEEQASEWELVMAGSVRNEGDEQRVKGLRVLAQDLGIADRVSFVVNAPYPDLLKLLGKASVGLSTMVDEHFGINVVEFMSAGLIPLVHASGGPLLDIVTPLNGQRTGYHASDPGDFAAEMREIAALDPEEALSMRARARNTANDRFSERNFDDGWMKAWKALVELKV